MKCNKCGQPLKEWEVGRCERCGLQRTRSHTKNGVTVKFVRDGCFLKTQTPKGNELRIQTQRFSGWEVVVVTQDGEQRSVHRTQRAALSKAVDVFTREQDA